MKQVAASITSNYEIMPGVYLIWLESSSIVSEAKPGQFVMVLCANGSEFPLRRPFSIHQTDGNKLALLFNVVGKGTQWLAQCQAGDNIDLLGPLGNSYAIHPASHNLLLVAGGMGIAPLRFLYDEAVERKCNIKLLVGAKTAAQLDIEHLFPKETDIIFIREETLMGKGRMGKVTILIPDYADWIDQVFACGPVPMYTTMAQMPELRNKPVQISREVRMGCGLGVCYGCTVKTRNGLKQVCKYGPVFDLDDILWEELNY